MSVEQDKKTFYSWGRDVRDVRGEPGRCDSEPLETLQKIYALLRNQGPVKQLKKNKIKKDSLSTLTQCSISPTS